MSDGTPQPRRRPCTARHAAGSQYFAREYYLGRKLIVHASAALRVHVFGEPHVHVPHDMIPLALLPIRPATGQTPLFAYS